MISIRSKALRAAAIAVAALLPALALGPSAARADALADILKSGEIRIAVPQDFPPFGMAGTDMQLQGYDIDMAKLIAQQMKVKLALVPVTSANRLPYLQTKKVDLVISTLGKTPDREKVIDFSNAYAPFFFGVFGPASIKISGPADLAGKTIGATRGALEEIELGKIAPPTAVIQRFEDNNTTMTAYVTGQVELIATGNAAAAVIGMRDPSKKPETKIVMKVSPCFIGLNKGEPALLAKVNEIIKDARAAGTLNGFSEKWLGEKLPADLP
jgi:polar amino acid transport system substrate-binding protein